MKTRESNWVTELTNVLPLATICLAAVVTFYSHQSQLVELRAKYETTIQSLKEDVQDVRLSLKEIHAELKEYARNGSRK